jgi:fibronectin-binding autotransporter adhesin
MLTKTGSGTLMLAQATPRSGLSSSWLGNITVSDGTLKVGNGSSTGFLPGYDPIAYAGLPPTVPTVSVADGATLEFNHAAGGPTQDTAHAVVISGFGGVVISGSKTEVFVANNTYTGSTYINSGSSLRVGWGGSFNTGGLGTTWVHNSGALTFSNDHNTTFPGSTSGIGTLLKEYSGTLTVTGAIAHTGGTSIASGTLQIGNDGMTGLISGNITNNATLAFQRSNAFTYSGVVSGSGAVVQRGAGTLVLIGTNSYSGGTTVNAGTLLVNNSSGSGTGSGAVVVNSGATLGGTGTIAGAITVNSGGHIAPGASIESLDVGSLTLAAGSILDFELDTVLGVDHSDVINVTTAGGLTIGGATLNLSDVGTMTTGTYMLIDYNGTLGGSVNNITLGSTPSDFTYNLVHNTSNTSIDLVVGIPGDHNSDSSVDAADYVVWRTSIGTQEAYDAWRSNFGRTASGSGMSTGVPEPATGLLLSMGIVALYSRLVSRFVPGHPHRVCTK